MMKKKGIGLGKKILSMVLALSMMVSVMPTNVFAVNATNIDSTSANVDKIVEYANNLLVANAKASDVEGGTKTNYSTGGFTWDTEGKTDSWRYYNGVMLEAFLMVSDYLSESDAEKSQDYLDFIKSFYDDNTSMATDGTASITNYIEGEVDSVPPVLAMFELLKNAEGDATIADSISGTSVDISNPNATVATYDSSKNQLTFTGQSDNGAGMAVTNPFPSLTGATAETGASISFWVNATGYLDQANAPIISFLNIPEKVEGDTYYRPLRLKLDLCGNREFVSNVVGDGNIKYSGLNSSSTMNTGTEYFVTLVINESVLDNTDKTDDSKGLQLYVNGKLVETATCQVSYGKIDSVAQDTVCVDIIDFLKDSNTKMCIGGLQVNLTDGDGKSLLSSVYDGDNINSNYKHVLTQGTTLRDLTVYPTAVDGTALYNQEMGISTEKQKYQAVIQAVYYELEKQKTYGDCGGTYLHKQDSTGAATGGWTTWNVALDGLYMTLPFLMECANAIDAGSLSLKDANGNTVTSAAIYEKVYTQLNWVAEKMYDSETGLYHHAWSAASNEGNGAFWGRAIGWYAVALTNVIDMLPENSTYKATLTENLKKLLDGMLKWQDADTGMWTNVVNREEAFSTNRLETSCSAMMAYALLKAYNSGFVSDAKYGLAGLRAFNGIMANKYSDGVVSDIYKKSGAGSTDEYYCTEEYVSDEAKGTGALIMAATLANATVTKLSETSIISDTVYSAQVKDSATAISVAGSGATSITVTNVASNENVLAAVADVLTSYEAYEITYFGEAGNTLVATTNAGTITLPFPVGAEAENIAVYKLDESNNLIPIDGTIYRSNFIFRTLDTSATYIIGTNESEYDDLNWKYIDKYILVDDMVVGQEYVITQADNYWFAVWGYDTNNVITTTNITNAGLIITGDNNNLYDISTVNNKNTWYISQEGYLYSKGDNGESLYLNRIDSDTVFGSDLSYTNDCSWDVINDSGKLYLKNTANDVYMWMQNDGLYAHTEGTSLDLYTKAQAAIDGVTEYTTYVGDGNVTIDVIKENATVYLKNSETGDPIALSWDELTCTWDTEYQPNTADTYTLTVFYDEVNIGTITVTVKDSSWTTIDKTYCLVDELVEGNEYIITACSSNDKEYYVRWYQDENNKTVLITNAEDGVKPSVAFTKVTSTGNVADFYSITPSNQYNSWYVDGDGHLYTIGNDGVKYYLQCIDTGKGLGLVTEDSVTSTWELDKLSTDKIVYLKASSEVDNYTCVKIGSGGVSKATYTNSQIELNVWARNPVTAVRLDGKLEYNITNIDSSITEETILENAKIYCQTFDSTTTSIVDWDDSNVSYTWSSNNGEPSLNTAVAGTYTMTVTYADKTLGNIVVNVTETEWVDVTEYYYERVNTLTAGNSYVITDSASNSEIDSQQGVEKTVVSLGTNTSDNGYSFAKDICISKNTDDTYLITNISDDNYWYYDSDQYLYTTIGNTRYNLLNYNTNDGKLRVLSHKAYPNYISWSVLGNNDGTVKLKNITIVNETETANYIAYNSSGNYFYNSTDSSDVNTNLTLYAVANDIIYNAALGGKLNYTISSGDKYITDTIVKKNADILLKSTTDNETITTEVGWSDSKVVYTWTKNGSTVKTLDSTVPGTYVMSVTYDEEFLGTVTVDVVAVEAIDGVLTGNTKVETYLGREPIFDNLKYTVTYSDGTKEVITVANGLTVTGYDLSVEGEQTAYIYYGGTLVGTVVINVTNDVYAGLNDATEYPEYPEEGAVRIDKFADNSDFLFRNTGVTKVELDVAGITTSKALDVVLVVDVSNSMGWSHDWFNTYDPVTATEAQKISYKEDGTVDLDTDDKLDTAMKAATKFAEILLEDNVDEYATGFEKNNTVSMVTFAGHDWNNIDQSYVENDKIYYEKYVDSVSYFLKHEFKYENAKEQFEATKFTAKEVTSSNGVNYTIQLGTTENDLQYSGLNRGNTNYDYAFAETMYAINDVENYWSGRNVALDERETVVIFMTDGAPSHYNDQRANGGAPDYIVGTDIKYPAESNYDANTDGKALWTEYISNPNTYAQEMVELSDAFYVVGFDMAHGGFKNYAWEANELEPVLWNLAGKNSDGTNVVDGLEMPDTADELVQFYTDLANTLVQSGTEARVTDIIKSDFTLQMGTSFPYVDETSSSGEVIDNSETEVKVDGTAVEPCIEVNVFDLWTTDEVENLTGLSDSEKNELALLKKYMTNNDIIGTRQTTGSSDSNGTLVLGSEVTTLLEKVTFNEAGTEAYSTVYTTDSDGNITGTTSGNIMSTKSEVTYINAQYFTYTNGSGVEKFVWNIGDINDDEIALSYYVYLKDSRSIEDSPEDGVYDTNEAAYLEYIDINHMHATKLFPVPQRPWGTAITEIEYYLVDKDTGQPVDWKGNVVPFSDRIVVSKQPYVQKIRWGESLNVYGYEHVPSQYTMYNQDAYYTVVTNDGLDEDGNLDNSGDTGTLTVHDSKEVKNDSSIVEYSTRRVDTNGDNVGVTQVEFGVYSTKGLYVGNTLGEDRVVVDYGKDIEIDVLANNEYLQTLINKNEMTAEVVGLVQYSSDEDYINYTQTNIGGTTLECYYGNFSLDTEKDIVTYEMTHMLEDVEKIFTVVEIIGKDGTEYEDMDYYLYQPLFVIPATSVYYETDFVEKINGQANANNVFTYMQSDGDDEGSGYSNWTTVTDASEGHSVEVTSDNVQDDGTVGNGQTYGYDDSYKDDAYISDGSSRFVEGESTGDGATTVSFSFTGTGFDLISRTGKEQGKLKVVVTDASTNEKVKTIHVLNKHESEIGDFYQIPVISIEGLPHGDYNVLIEAYAAWTYNAPFDYLSRGGEFYFDAVRIYDPIDVADTTLLSSTQYGAYDRSKLTSEMIALNAYATDGEAYEDVTEIRDILIDAGKYDETLGEEAVNGVLFIERYAGESGEETTTPAPEITATPEATPTATPEATPTATPEATPTATPEATPTATPEATPTATEEATSTEFGVPLSLNVGDSNSIDVTVDNTSVTFGNTCNSNTYKNNEGIAVDNPFKDCNDLNAVSITLKVTYPENISGSNNWNYYPLITFVNSSEYPMFSYELAGKMTYYSDANISIGYYDPTNLNVEANKGHLVTLVIDNSGVTTYLDENLINYNQRNNNSNIAYSNILELVKSAEAMYIGGTNESPLEFITKRTIMSGTIISDVTVYDTALTADEVKTLYESTKTSEATVASTLSEVELNATTELDYEENSHNYKIGSYEAIGPNNETYLSEGQGIVFALNGIDVGNIASIDIGAKSVTGEKVKLNATISKDKSAIKDSTFTISQDLTSSTSQYYSLLKSNEEAETLIDTDNGITYIYIANGNDYPEGGYENSETDPVVLSITDLKIAYKSEPTVAQTYNIVSSYNLLSFASVCAELEPSYDIYSAEFLSDNYKLFSSAELVIETSEYVDSLVISDRFGREVSAEISYEDQVNGTREWTVNILMGRLGSQTYNVTAYGATGTKGDTVTVSTTVSKKGGGWQDAKNIYKTLFNCRIISIERNNGTRLLGFSENN